MACLADLEALVSCRQRLLLCTQRFQLLQFGQAVLGQLFRFVKLKLEGHISVSTGGGWGGRCRIEGWEDADQSLYQRERNVQQHNTLYSIHEFKQANGFTCNCSS